MDSPISATTCVPTATVHQTGPFFALPRELRDAIYDLLHQSEEEVEYGSFVFRSPLRVYHPCRQFKTEFASRETSDKRVVITGVDEELGDQSCWDKHKCPRVVRLGAYSKLELVMDEHHLAYCNPNESLWEPGHYRQIKESLLYSLVHAARGKLHSYVLIKQEERLGFLQDWISLADWCQDYSTKIEVMLYSSGDSMPDQASIARARKLATWTKALGWIAASHRAAEKAMTGPANSYYFGTFN